MNKKEYRINLINDYLKKLNLDEKISEYYKGKTILVTGGGGAIGSNLVIALSKLIGSIGKIIVLDNFLLLKVMTVRYSRNVQHVKGDIRSDIDLKEFFVKPTLFYLAAFLQIKIS